MEGNFEDDHTQKSKSNEVLSIAGPALATSSSQPLDSSKLSPSLASLGNGRMEEPKKEEEVPNSKVTTNGMLMNSRPTNEAIYGRWSLLKEQITARLEELTTTDPTLEVALEIVDSSHLLNFMNCCNQKMKRAGNRAHEGARHLREGAQLITESQQILRSAILNDQNPSSTQLPDEEKYDYPLEYLLQVTGMVVMNGRPTNEGIYGRLKVLKDPVMARLEVLMSMDSTAEVGLEIADSVHLLCLINAANHEMAKACERAGRGASRSIEGAQLVTKSQQILRSAILNEQEDDDEEDWARLQDLLQLVTKSQQILRSAILNEDWARPLVQTEWAEQQGACIPDFQDLLPNYGIYASVKSLLASGKGAKTPGSTTAQATNAEASQGSSTTQVADAGASSSHATPGS